MSYCRTSSDNWKSDVYVICNLHGWETMVAYNRLAPGVPTPDEQPGMFPREYVPIDHPDAGKSFLDDSPDACVLTLLRLRDSGLHVPEKAIERLLSEGP